MWEIQNVRAAPTTISLPWHEKERDDDGDDDDDDHHHHRDDADDNGGADGDVDDVDYKYEDSCGGDSEEKDL